jgi:hypothetical protein
MADKKDNSLSGVWHFCYWYPSNNHDGDDVSEYYVTAHHDGNELIMQSLPNSINAYLLSRLRFDGEVATGTWHETTSPTGAFKGAMYSGAGQLILSKDKKRLEGQWAGAGYDHKLKEPRIYTGKWVIERTAGYPAKP